MITIEGLCGCCTNNKTAELELDTYGDKIQIKLIDCMGSAKMELKKKEALAIFKVLCE